MISVSFHDSAADLICSCSACGKRNHEQTGLDKYSKVEGVQLLDLGTSAPYSNMTVQSHLCAECAAEMVAKLTYALGQVEMDRKIAKRAAMKLARRMGKAIREQAKGGAK